jgi:hypothetical protein
MVTTKGSFRYGFGLRVVTASGVVFRADLGFGREGFTPEIFIGYPWEIGRRKLRGNPSTRVISAQSGNKEKMAFQFIGKAIFKLRTIRQ